MNRTNTLAVALSAIALALGALAIGCIVADCAFGEELPDCRKEPCTLVLTTPEGGTLDCGRIRIRKNAQGQKFAQVRIPCEYRPAPSSTPAATRSPNFRPSPTEPNPCPGGCMVWNPVTDTTKCVRPCP